MWPHNGLVLIATVEYRVEEYSVLKSNIWYKEMHFLTQKYLIEYFIQNECFSHIINKLTSQNYMESILTSNF